MSHPNLQLRDRVADLGDGLSIWKVHIDCVREQEVNARVMQPRKFDQLTRNIQRRANLESLPYTYNLTPEDPATEFLLISGHHRVRAARAAGLQRSSS